MINGQRSNNCLLSLLHTHSLTHTHTHTTTTTTTTPTHPCEIFKDRNLIQNTELRGWLSFNDKAYLGGKEGHTWTLGWACYVAVVRAFSLLPWITMPMDTGCCVVVSVSMAWLCPLLFDVPPKTVSLGQSGNN